MGAEDASDCHQPHYPKTVAGVQLSMCKDGSSFHFVLGNGKPASDQQEDSFGQAHIPEFFAINGIVAAGGTGLCCIEDKADPGTFCMPFSLRLCTTPLPAFIDKLRAIQAHDDRVSNRALRVSVELQGLTGPRCEGEASDCGPVPYDADRAPAVPETRVPVDPLPTDGPACAHDGDCVVNGCGNECDHWTLGGAAGTCPYLTKLADAYCGCVDERCAWFQ
jgi:hypothetical protein